MVYSTIATAMEGRKVRASRPQGGVDALDERTCRVAGCRV